MENIGKHEATYTESGVSITVTYNVYDNGQVHVSYSSDSQWVHIRDLPSKVQDSLPLDKVNNVRDDLEEAIKGMTRSQLQNIHKQTYNRFRKSTSPTEELRGEIINGLWSPQVQALVREEMG